MVFGSRLMCCVGAAVAIVSPWSRCQAAGASSLKNALFGRPETETLIPVVAHYQGEDGQMFVFDRIDRREALLKFDNDPEIWALTPTMGPRGDIIYKNDIGEPFLRATRLGGLTVFTALRPAGAAAALIGQALPPRPPTLIGPEALIQLSTQASARASRAAQHLVEFVAPEVTPVSESVYAEAFVIAAEAFVRVSQRGPTVQKMMTRYSIVRFTTAKSPSASAHAPTVEIGVTPQLGVAGRPSSELVAEVISRR